MTFQSNGLRVIGACHGFALWHYATRERLSDVLAPGYFNPAYGLVRSGHHLHVTAAIRHDASGDWIEAADHALVAVTSARPGRVSVSPIGETRTARHREPPPTPASPVRAPCPAASSQPAAQGDAP